MTKVSVVVPVLNGAATLEASLQSALQQTLTDLEILVVDDGSTDATAQLVAQMAQKDRRIRLVSLDRNYGVSHARNVAIDEACGEWIAILDADDWIEPFRLARMLSAAEQLKADAVIDNLRIVDADTGCLQAQSQFGHRHKPIKLEPEHLFQKDTPLIYPVIGFAQPLLRTEYLREKKIRYNEKYRLGEDFVFLAEVVLQGGVLFALPFCGYTYRMRQNAFWEDRLDLQKSKRQYEDILAACHDFLARYASSLSLQAKKNLLRRMHLFSSVAKARAFKSLLHQKKWIEGAVFFLRAPSLFLYVLQLLVFRLIQSISRIKLKLTCRLGDNRS